MYDLTILWVDLRDFVLLLKRKNLLILLSLLDSFNDFRNIISGSLLTSSYWVNIAFICLQDLILLTFEMNLLTPRFFMKTTSFNHEFISKKHGVSGICFSNPIIFQGNQ